ncbi:bifunctional diguanylate cyclase/phosphodiesterase [Thalassobius sp. Cn5-15]|uniref:putative bifunctional diguanylate cyclase/phosphodiesterase n=1 Tax=Thalassobius sp. Cn5-15 TaxID=2917763 RepID=UPI001EF3B56A|nr:GGDEF domain-containing phosphodiesterase [Thalassobius sp. Cn5-15]MCG7493453.1 GGDEF domain-containing phosphodiesterase [Thalassobius sp. Cn5-15]
MRLFSAVTSVFPARGLPVRSLRRAFNAVMSGPQALAFLPALMLAALWLGGEGWLLAVALGLPALIAMNGGMATKAVMPAPLGLEATLDQFLLQCDMRNLRSALFLVAIDSFDKMNTQHGFSAADQVETHIAGQLQRVLRPDDRLFNQGGGKYAVVLAPVATLDLENALQLARRLQDTVARPVPLDGTALHMTCSVGFALERQMAHPFGPAMLEAAQAALDDALHNAPAAIRAYAPGMEGRRRARTDRLHDLVRALESGAIHPWFQPQISTETGEITGVEALARWKHSDQIVPPSEFLPLIEQHGLCERLGDVVLTHSLMALASWDQSGVVVPQVGVNFSDAELRNPKLVDKINWTLDRFDLAPSRLNVEILESVVAASPDDVVVQNIAKLATLGCGIDLDDFGTGNASITALSRFDVKRIKIDRSFVTSIDKDQDQQRLVAAILSMAEQLRVDSLAEGVETAEEHTLLAQMGCRHVQGFGIARPMPAKDTLDWLRRYQSRDPLVPEIGRTLSNRTR